MTVQNRAFNPLGESVYSSHSTTAVTVNLNYNNGTRTMRVVNDSNTASLHVKTINVGVAATTTNAMGFSPLAVGFIIIKAGQTQISVISSSAGGGQGWHYTLGDGGV